MRILITKAVLQSYFLFLNFYNSVVFCCFYALTVKVRIEIKALFNEFIRFNLFMQLFVEHSKLNLGPKRNMVMPPKILQLCETTFTRCAKISVPVHGKKPKSKTNNFDLVIFWCSLNWTKNIIFLKILHTGVTDSLGVCVL